MSRYTGDNPRYFDSVLGVFVGYIEYLHIADVEAGYDNNKEFDTLPKKRRDIIQKCWWAYVETEENATTTKANIKVLTKHLKSDGIKVKLIIPIYYHVDNTGNHLYVASKTKRIKIDYRFVNHVVGYYIIPMNKTTRLMINDYIEYLVEDEMQEYTRFLNEEM